MWKVVNEERQKVVWGVLQGRSTEDRVFRRLGGKNTTVNLLNKCFV